MSFDSLLGTACPFCGTGVFWTDDPEEYHRHHEQYTASELLFVEGIEGGGWRPSVEIKVRGRVGRLTRDDLLSTRIYPVQCTSCRKVFVAHLGVTNRAEVEHYETAVRPNSPPRREGDEVLPKWAMVGYPPRAFVEEVNAIKNPLIRSGLIRRLNGSRFRFDGLAEPTAQPPAPPRRGAAFP